MHTFLLPLYIVHFRQENLFFESTFSISGSRCISTKVKVTFREKFWVLLVQHDKVPFFDFNLTNRFQFSPMLQIILTPIERK